MRTYPVGGGVGAGMRRNPFRGFVVRYLPTLIIVGVALSLLLSRIVLNIPVTIALLLLLGAGAALIIVLRPLLGFYLFVGTFSFESVVDFPDILTPVKFLGMLVFAGWAVSVLVGRGYHLPRSSVLIWTPIFLVWAWVCLSVAEDGGAALARLGTLVQLTVLVFLTATILRDRKDLERVSWVLLFSTLMSAIYGVFQFVGGQQSGQLEGLATNRNTIGIFLAMCVPLLVYHYQRSSSALARVILMTLAGILLLAEALSFSRGGFVIMILSIILSLLLVTQGSRFRLALVILPVVLVVVFLIPATYWQRVSTITSSVVEGKDTMGLRYELWRVSSRMIQDHPIMGVGPGNYLTHFMRYSGMLGLRRSPLTAHNSYLGVATELGLVGGGLFVIILGAALRAYYKAARLARRSAEMNLASLASSFGIALVLFCVAGTKGGLERYKYLWLLIGLSAAVWGIALRQRRSPVADDEVR